MADALENVCETLLTLTLPLNPIMPKADSFRLVVSRRGKTSLDEYKNFGGPAAATRYPNHNRDEPKRPSLVAKMSKPGKYCVVHNFSHPHEPSAEVTSINSCIDSNSFPCTWGTFTTVALIIVCLPPSSQASVRDVAEAYRTIPALPTQWPGLVI